MPNFFDVFKMSSLTIIEILKKSVDPLTFVINFIIFAKKSLFGKRAKKIAKIG